MARSNYGPFGPFTGKLGPMNGYILRGKGVLRLNPHITKPRSVNQLAVQQRMQVLSPFLNLIKIYLRVGFELAGIENGNSANNSAKSYNLTNSVKGIYPTQEVDYPAVRLTEGSLALPLNPLISPVAGGIDFTWDFDQYERSGSGFDRTMLMAYIPVKNVCFYVIGGALRSSRFEHLPIMPGLQGLEAETYLSFIRDDRSSISNSVYTGKVVVV
ncbi:MAG: hypothetical protein EOO92_11100 [Pedobacter sp.]|nr:MAG: hypothetical protein EOO92_11100 [Pedobacter sp.]